MSVKISYVPLEKVQGTGEGTAQQNISGADDVVEKESKIVVITLRRPERRNALNKETLHELQNIFGNIGNPRVIILTGAEGNFCSGADLSEVEDTEFIDTLHTVLSFLRETPAVTIAAVEGFALGAGTQLALACDLRVATSDATFGIPAVKLGLITDQWTIRRAASLFGQSISRSMLLTGETYSGERGYSLGFVQRLGNVDEAIIWAETIVKLAPLTIEGFKQGLNECEYEEAADMQKPSASFQKKFEEIWASEDLQNGLQAFQARQVPQFNRR